MRDIPDDRLEQGRILQGDYASRLGDCHGAFHVIGPAGKKLTLLSSGTRPAAVGWEHVSVSVYNRTPTWAEMCFVKDLFWRDDELVIQYHPAKADYVNHHPYCLHLWRSLDTIIPVPPVEFVGPRT